MIYVFLTRYDVNNENKGTYLLLKFIFKMSGVDTWWKYKVGISITQLGSVIYLNIHLLNFIKYFLKVMKPRNSVANKYSPTNDKEKSKGVPIMAVDFSYMPISLKQLIVA